eukprot:TRINITY_DN18944_c0_g1_i1.p1 TRINITY_DN18944_c0_g1~~TRINITY_DN18944_c0_g1_i1.p1  ORF type:complete len:606 (+),score=233.73 TRINITY_DN18944_c0_g1_i1:285-2102(+)
MAIPKTIMALMGLVVLVLLLASPSPISAVRVGDLPSSPGADDSLPSSSSLPFDNDNEADEGNPNSLGDAPADTSAKSEMEGLKKEVKQAAKEALSKQFSGAKKKTAASTADDAATKKAATTEAKHENNPQNMPGLATAGTEEKASNSKAKASHAAAEKKDSKSAAPAPAAAKKKQGRLLKDKNSVSLAEEGVHIVKLHHNKKEQAELLTMINLIKLVQSKASIKDDDDDDDDDDTDDDDIFGSATDGGYDMSDPSYGSALSDDPPKNGETDKVKLMNYMGTEYFGKVQIGTPKAGEDKQYFHLLFDTGSANFWVTSKDCPDEGCQPHRKFDHSKSSTYRRVGDKFRLEYANGKCNGFLGRDTITIGDLAIPDQTLGEITRLTGYIFKFSKYDGIVGLSYPTIALRGVTPVFDNVEKENPDPLKRDQFSFFLSTTPGEYGALVLGGTLPGLHHGDFHYAPVVKKGYWLVKMDDVKLGGKSLGFCDGGCQVAVDTGTALIAGPKHHMKHLNHQLGISPDCSNTDQLKDIEFVINGKSLKLTPQQYTRQVNSMLGSGMCVSGFLPLNVPHHNGLWIFGDVFLRAYYTVFDRQNNRVGFAKANPNQEVL